MKRFGVLSCVAALGLMLTGCEGGLKEGAPPEAAKSPSQTPEFQDFMKQNAAKMKMKKPANSPARGKTQP